MSISVFYITNVLRTYNHILKRDESSPSQDSGSEGFTEDTLSISEEGKQRLSELQARAKSAKGEGETPR